MWSTASSPPARISGTAVFNIDTLYALCSGGVDADSGDTIGSSFKYSSMGNFWSGRANSDTLGRKEHSAFSVNTGIGLVCFGSNSADIAYNDLVSDASKRYIDGEIKFVGFATSILEYV